MGIFSFFRARPKGSATTAKERLQVLIAHQHTDNKGPDYLPLLKQDILNVIKKYVDIGEEQVVVQLDSQDDCDILELNITLPEDGERGSEASARKTAVTSSLTNSSKKGTGGVKGSKSPNDEPVSSTRQSRRERTRARQTRNEQSSARKKAGST